MTNTAYIALGSNLNHPTQQVASAIIEINHLTNTSVEKQSSLYVSQPMGPEQPDFINAVIKITSAYNPQQLLNALQAIENNHQRTRNQLRWGPRTLDLDILLYNQEVMTSEVLTIPHYGLKQRSFVIIPLAEIEPHLVLPCGTSIQSLLRQVPKEGIDVKRKKILVTPI